MEYRVLARKYRPTTFDDLIGQEVLVRTLSNAIASGRIAHAFLLTGIRGVGKTTTARIIARALNCIGADAQGGPTIRPCGVCTNCKMIAEDRHVDVIEMDAASHTGVGDIRELIDTVRYLPSSARYKIYIIDEVHMLSTSAFNALLKTLEEPPPHVKFIFATTEARKIPVTILSRCQRFDLKRVERNRLAQHLGMIAGKEEVSIEEDALQLIALSAEGSVRDALSLLDQAIARGAGEDGKGAIDAAMVRQMIGAADNTLTFRLLETLLKGEVAEALALLRQHYADGADPLLMVQDCLEITHLVTRVKVAPAALSDITLSQHEREAAKTMADGVSMPVLARLWQMLLKGVNEVRHAPAPLSALEMLLVRIAYAAQLPTPLDVIRASSSETSVASAPAAPAAEPRPVSKPNLEPVSAQAAPAQLAPVQGAPAPQPAASMPVLHKADTFEEMVKLFAQQREPLLYSRLKQDVRLVKFEPGLLEIRLTSQLSRDFAPRLGECMTRWTGQPWKVILRDDAEGELCLHDQEIARKEQNVKDVSAHPLVASALEQFPGAKVVQVKTTQGEMA